MVLHHSLSEHLPQVALLQRYNISLSESSLKQLEEAPVAWAALQKKITVRCAIASLKHASTVADMCHLTVEGSRSKRPVKPLQYEPILLLHG